MYNINKLFPWLSIRSKLIIAFAGLSVIPLALVGIHSIFSNVEMMKRIALENLTHDVHSIKEKTANFLANVDSDLRLLRNYSLLQGSVELVNHTSRHGVDERLQRVASEFYAFVKTRGIYYQLRIVSEAGDELVRVESMMDSANGSYRIVPREELRQTQETYYFLLVETLGQDEIAFAPAELKTPAGNRVPVISMALPIFDGKRRAGILIANVFAKDLFRLIEEKRHLSVEGKVVLVSSDGHYLYHTEKKKDWNRLLAARLEDNLQHDYPDTVVTTLLSGNEGIITEGVDEIISYAPLFPIKNKAKERSAIAGVSVPFYIFESVQKETILGPARSFAWAFAAFLGLFLLTAVALGLLATRQFTKPIAVLQNGAEIIAKGNYRHRLQIETNDEIEKLASQFNIMAASLEEHEHEIEEHRANLEEMVQQRTRELTDEKLKLQAIIDNVPSAFVLLNRNLEIQTASAVFTAITGKRLQEVRGQDCRTVLRGIGFCEHALCEQALHSVSVKSHTDVTKEANGLERFIEHTAIPLKENGEITAILEIITDVTARKQLEQDLIKAEKLTAAGEMSAIIAHEFRNGLTSIKMILQLQREGKHLGRADKRSLTVALNSLYQMEAVVNELLNYARPSPMELRSVHLGAIIEESIGFVRLQAEAQNISIHKQIYPHLPMMTLDPSRWKEAISNILLNAIQAIEGKGPHRNEEKILIEARRVVLGTRLHNSGETISTVEKNRNGIGRREGENLLRRGTECILIQISDTGPGIEQQFASRIFDPFFTTKANGTGLGLPLVKRTVNAHGGVVQVKSSPKRGATFSLYVPVNGRQA